MLIDRSRYLACLAGFAVTLSASAAQAQVAEGLMESGKASEGSTEVADAGFAAATKDEPAEESKDATEFKLSAGGMVSSGNSRMIALTGASQFRVRRDASQLGGAFAVNVSKAGTEPGEGMEPTAENYQGKIRYDHFLGSGFAVFLAVSARRDRFQGLDLRLNVDPGVAYYFIDEEKQQLWGELGYDLQYDVRRDENLEEAAAEGTDLDKTDLRHSGRAFAGYQSTLNDVVTVSTGLEYLQGLPDTEYWRLNWDGGISSNLKGALSTATTVSVRYDNHPLPGIAKTDVVTAISLVYQAL
jgi:putative salt-induced outer membrane protein